MWEYPRRRQGRITGGAGVMGTKENTFFSCRGMNPGVGEATKVLVNITKEVDRLAGRYLPAHLPTWYLDKVIEGGKRGRTEAEANIPPSPLPPLVW